MVLSGVVEEKSSRVEGLLLVCPLAACSPADRGHRVLGLVQIGLTAAVALFVVTHDRLRRRAGRPGAVLAWVVVWFVLGYALVRDGVRARSARARVRS